MEAALEAGVSFDMIHRWERGYRVPRLRTLHKLARAYDIPVRQLIELTGDA